MRKWIRSYLVFTSLIYRIAVYVLLPCGLVGAAVYRRHLGDAAMVTVTAVFILAEILADNWLFGGIHTARGVKMEYLRTSSRGMALMKRALVMDVARRFLAGLVILACCGLALGLPGVSGYLLFPGLVSFFLAELGVFCARFFDMLWVNMLIGYGGAVLGILCWTLPGLQEMVWVYNLVFAILGVMCGVVAVRTALKKVEGGYYEK